ncbi:MAG: aldehyde dehydrogenase family protein [Paenibacillaceae bacterium]|nr:aldehyde dehydrogenase family protein [Paenibacillaceae bacterium]
MDMYINGRWVSSPSLITIASPYSGEAVDTVPAATAEQAEEALQAASRAAVKMASLSGYERAQLLQRAAALLEERVETFAVGISLEMGKPIGEARNEVKRLPDLLRLCAFEGSQVRGETLPLDAHAGVAAHSKFGLTSRIPCGVVVAITPFNYPLLLVLHKIGPALAAGNAVILKPATQTSLTALRFTALLYEAGLPENGLQCVTGSGSVLGGILCADDRVRKISFTGSSEVGRQITRIAGVKKMSLELGSNCPLVIMPGADLDKVAKDVVVGGFANAGQVCISTQRIFVHEQCYADFLDAVRPKVASIRVGDPLDDATKLGAMISEAEAARVDSWVSEAVDGGATIVTGGTRAGAVYAPTVVANVLPDMKLSCRELFGPAVAISRFASIDEAIGLANDSPYGLGAGIYTNDIGDAFRFAQRVHTGNIMINSTPLWRADLMPYGGFKQSGTGKEGVRYAVEEMTEIKTIVFHQLN